MTCIIFQDFLISEVTLENCVDIGHIANAYNLSRVDHHVNVFMLQNFNLVNDFNKVPYERLRFLMSSNNLKVYYICQLRLISCFKRYVSFSPIGSQYLQWILNWWFLLFACPYPYLPSKGTEKIDSKSDKLLQIWKQSFWQFYPSTKRGVLIFNFLPIFISKRKNKNL